MVGVAVVGLVWCKATELLLLFASSLRISGLKNDRDGMEQCGREKQEFSIGRGEERWLWLP